jgi:hypothetical protein
MRMERVGDRLKISFLDSPDYISQVFLPHSGVYSDEDLTAINSGHTFYTLAYRGHIGESAFHVVDVLNAM